MIRSLLYKQLARVRPELLQARIATWRERMLGVDFSQPASLDKLGLDATRSVKYSPSDDRHLRQLLDSLPIQSTDRILDYGCGKGRALRTMREYPFGATDGVELSPELAATARRNFARLKRTSRNVQIFESDAATFTAIDDYTHFYLYNPFPSVVVRPVVANMYASFQRHARDITVIYYNAVCISDFVADNRFKIVSEDIDHEGNRSCIVRLTT